MDIELLMNSMGLKFPFTAFKYLLKRAGLPLGKGWPGTAILLPNYFKQNPSSIDKFKELKKTYEECLFVGNKTSHFYRIDEKTFHEALINFFRGVDVPETIYSRYYPYAIPKEKLADCPIDSYFVVDIKDTSEWISVVFCNNRVKELYTTLDKDRYRGSQKALLSQFNKVVGITERPTQTFDILNIHKSRQILEIRLDISQPIRMRPEKVKSNFQGAIVRLNEEMLKFEIFKNILPLNSLNEAFYNNKDGTLVDLGFGTDDSFDRHTFNNNASEDIRDTNFHMKAVDGIRHLDPYRTGVKWPINEDEFLLLQIPGSRRNIEKPINEARALNCYTFNDYDFVLNKIFQYISV